MQALIPRVFDAVWQAVEGRVRERVSAPHPLGCHRGRVSDRTCFYGMVVRLVTGCSWRTAALLCHEHVSATTLRNRRTEWLSAGVYDALCEEALHAYDKIIGLDLSEVAVDGSLHKAPAGGEGTGKSPVDRAKLGWKWSVATDARGIPIGWVVDGANRHDSVLLEPTLATVAARGLLVEIETLWLDRGYDSDVTRERIAALGIEDAVIAQKSKKGSTRASGCTTQLSMGLRWPVERTNSWMSNYGQLRRNTDRAIEHRLAQFALAVTFILTIKLFAYADRWNS